MNTETIYTCPMHPDVVSDKPGRCPKCGMDLEAQSSKPKVQKSEHQEHEHSTSDHSQHHAMMAADFKRRFFLVLPLTVAVLVLSPKIQEWLGFSLIFPGINLFLFALSTVIVLFGGWPFYQAAFGELKTKNWGMMTLVSVAVLSGYTFSVLGTFFFPLESFYWEISTLVLAFLFGHWLEMRAVLGTGNALAQLAKLIPPSAHKLIGRQVKDVATEELVKGDLVLVRPGEKIPIDGEVVEGTSSVNEGMVTGESRPIAKKAGDAVIGGTINNDGSLTVRVTKTGTETALAQIMNLIRAAQETKPAVQKLADRAANWLTIIAIVGGISTFVYWFLLNPSGAVFAATLAITVVVITCPHALGLAIPTVTTITTALAAKNGILIRDMAGLEVARKLDYIVLDKTGTLTEGNFGVAKIVKSKQSTVNSDEILRLAAAVEVHSEHSIAKGIVAEGERQKIRIPAAKNFKAYPGKGATARIDGELVVVGNKKLFEDLGFKIQDLGEETTGTTVLVGSGEKILGVILLEDRIRPESKKAIDTLHQMGIKIAMLTGDKKDVAEKVGRQLGIDTVFAEVLPEDKVNKVKKLQSDGYQVAMVGDGVNDAPSLTQAHVGIAIGAGTDVAIESAEIVLVKSNPLDIVKVISLSKKTDAKMKQNLVWATGYNLLAIPAAAGVFTPLGVVLRPEWGALLMSASSVIVVLNALGLRKTIL